MEIQPVHARALESGSQERLAMQTKSRYQSLCLGLIQHAQCLDLVMLVNLLQLQRFQSLHLHLIELLKGLFLLHFHHYFSRFQIVEVLTTSLRQGLKSTLFHLLCTSVIALELRVITESKLTFAF